MKNNNSLTILGWMLNECELSGSELLCFAYIYGLTQGDSVFCGTNEDISGYIGISKESVRRIIVGLIEKDLLIKQECVFNDKKISVLSTKTQKLAKIEEKLNAPYINIYNADCINNNINNNAVEEKKRDKSLCKKVGKDDLFDECWKAYRRKGSKKVAKTHWVKLSDEDKQKVKTHICHYVSAASDRKYQKDFERYLRDRIFDTPVYHNNNLVYDPESSSNTDYHPYGNNSIIWNENMQMYVIVGDIRGGIIDGYTNESRPNGAKIFNQGRCYMWNSGNARWEIVER